jgi:hypothetical protein
VVIRKVRLAQLKRINVLQEVTRRAARGAATSNLSDIAVMNALRQNAVFRNPAGSSCLGACHRPAIPIDYLALLRLSDGSTTLVEISNGSLPSCPCRNRQICMNDLNASILSGSYEPEFAQRMVQGRRE